VRTLPPWSRGLLALSLWLSLAVSRECWSQSPAATAPSITVPADSPAGKKTASAGNIARRILQMDAQVRPVTERMFQTLNEVLDDARVAIGRLPPNPGGPWDPRYAKTVLRRIDSALVARGFLYPDSGGVDLLADALTPFQMSAAQRRSFEAHPRNRRRSVMISQRFPGPFYVLDCDTASFLYLGVAEQLGLPLHIVTIPACNRRSGHAFVRWREGSRYLDWETMDGVATTDEYYTEGWKIKPVLVGAGSALSDLSPEQVIGCEYYLSAVQRERRGEYELALRDLLESLDLYPQNLDARREFAWITATGPGVRVRNNAKAIDDARFVLRLVDDPDARDTLAAAYASAGKFDLAVKEEKAAILNGERSSAAGAGYKRRLTLYQQDTPYRQAETGHNPAGVLQP
jgi:hypothetical protein